MPPEPPLRITVRLTPRGGRDAIEGWTRDAAGAPVLRARVAAPPADGGANESLLRLLAKSLGVPRTSLHIVAGASSRTKVIEVEGVNEDRLLAL